MSLNFIAVIIFLVGGFSLIAFLLFEGEKRGEKLPTENTLKTRLDDVFTDDNDQVDTHSLYEGYVVDRFIINRRQHIIYERLERLLSGDFRISPKIRISDVIRPEKRILETDPERARELYGHFNNARFDFVVTDLDNGEIRGVIMAESTINLIPSGQFIIELLNKMHIPLFRYDEDREIPDDELSDLLYETFEEAHND